MPVDDKAPPEWEKCMLDMSKEEPGMDDEARARICWDAIKKTHIRKEDGTWVKKENLEDNPIVYEQLERQVSSVFQDGLHKPKVSKKELDGGYRDIELLALKPGKFNGVDYPLEVLKRDAKTWVEREDDSQPWFMMEHNGKVADRAGPIIDSFYCPEKKGIMHKARLTNRRAIDLYDDGLLTTTSVEMVVGIDMEASEPGNLVAGWIKGTDNAFVHKPACKACGLTKFEEINANLEERENIKDSIQFKVNSDLINNIKTNIESLEVLGEDEADKIIMAGDCDNENNELKDKVLSEYLLIGESVLEKGKTYYRYPLIVNNKINLGLLKTGELYNLEVVTSDVRDELLSLGNAFKGNLGKEGRNMDDKTFNEKVKTILMGLGLVKGDGEGDGGDVEPTEPKKGELEDKKDKGVSVELTDALTTISTLEERVVSLEEEYKRIELAKYQLEEDALVTDIVAKAKLLELDLKAPQLLEEIKDIEGHELRLQTLKAIEKGYDTALSKIPKGMIPNVIDGKLGLIPADSDEYTDEELEEKEKEINSIFIG